MRDQPWPIITEHNPVFFQPYTTPQERASEAAAHKAVMQTASREASEREAAYLRSLNPPQVQIERPSLKQPVLPDHFSDQAAALDEEIFSRGVAIDRHRLFELGKERFQELLQRDRTCRSVQRVIGTRTDLSSWPSVEFAFAQTGKLMTGVPKRKTAEQFAGAGLDREQAARIAGFRDLWKTTSERQLVRDVYAFHDAFTRLLVGQSLLERLGTDGRVRSKLFCGGRGRKVALFNDWLATLTGSHFTVTLVEPLSVIMTWLTGETTPLPQPAELARDWFGTRAPSSAQIKGTQAIVEGFMLDHRGWALWDYVGNKTLTAVDQGQLETWRMELSKRFNAIAAFQDVLHFSFNKPVARGFGDSHLQFDAPAHRAFINGAVATLLQTVSALVAQAVEETHAVVARFTDSLLVEGKPKQPTAFIERITSKLNTAFGGANFQVIIKEVK